VVFIHPVEITVVGAAIRSTIKNFAGCHISTELDIGGESRQKLQVSGHPGQNDVGHLQVLFLPTHLGQIISPTAAWFRHENCAVIATDF
jgi:hypothetical protein